MHNGHQPPIRRSALCPKGDYCEHTALAPIAAGVHHSSQSVTNTLFKGTKHVWYLFYGMYQCEFWSDRIRPFSTKTHIMVLRRKPETWSRVLSYKERQPTMHYSRINVIHTWRNKYDQWRTTNRRFCCFYTGEEYVPRQRRYTASSSQNQGN